MNTSAKTHLRRVRFWTPTTVGLQIAFCVSVSCLVGFLVAYEPLVAVLGLSAAVTCGVILFRPFVGIPVLMLLGIAGDLQHFEVGLSFAQGVAVLLAIGFIARLAVGRISLRRTGLEIPLLAFTVLYCVLSSRDLGHTMGTGPAALLTMLGYPIVFLIILNLVRTQRQVKWIVGTLAVGALLASLTTVLQYFGDYSLLYAVRGIHPADTSLVTTGWYRANGLMQSPNIDAYPHLLAIPLLIAVALAKPGRRATVGVLAVTAASGFVLALTFSRGGYLGVCAGLLWLAFKLPLRQGWRVLAVASALVILVLAFIPPQALVARFERMPEELGTGSDRLIQYAIGMNLLLKHPLIGGGERLFQTGMLSRFSDSGVPHSNLLSVAVNSGLIGLAALLWMVTSYVRFLRRGLASIGWSPLKYYAIGSYAGLFAFLVQGMFVTNMGWSLVWAMAALPPCCILVAQHSSISHSAETVDASSKPYEK